MNITTQRLKELERAEAKLQALEAGGVDNWEWYGESLKGWREENEIEELKDDFINELSECFGQCAYEPSERGAGIAFTDGVEKEVMALINKFITEFGEIKNQDD